MRQKKYDAIRSLVRELSLRSARHREWYIDNTERLTHPAAQFQAGLLLMRIRAEWRAEKRESGL